MLRLLIPCALGLWLAAPPAPARAAAGSAAQDPAVERLLERVLRQRDRTRPQVFGAIAAHGTPAAFEALREAVAAVRAERLVQAGYRAFVDFRERPGLARDAVVFLFEEARDHAREENQRAAAAALALYGEAARAELEELFQRHRDEALRRIVLQPLVPALGRQGTPEAARAILEYGEVDTPAQRAAVRAALAACTGDAVTAAMAQHLQARSTSVGWKELLLELLAERGDARAVDAVADALGDREAAVRARALELLGRLGDASRLADLRRHLRARDEAERREAVVAVGRLAAGDPAWTRELRQHARSSNAGARLGACVALTELRTGEATRELARLAADGDWRVRAQALACLGALRRADGVPLLIERLAAESGRLRADAARALRLVTGLDHGLSAERWSAWWAAQGEGFRPPPLDAVRAAEAARTERRGSNETQATFYGLAVLSERVAFVLDVSGSMGEPAGTAVARYGGRAGGRGRGGGGPTRLDVAKDELGQALRRLSPGVHFNVIFFESLVDPWRPELVEHEAQAVEAAVEFARERRLGRGTNLWAGLMTALADPRVDTLYLLSDGDPTEGDYVEPTALAERFARQNRTRQVTVHGIAIGQASPLLARLAADSGGTYVESL